MLANSGDKSNNRPPRDGPWSTKILTPQHACAANSVLLADPSGVQVDLVRYGAAIQAIRVPAGARRVNVVLGYDAADSYLTDPHFLGATVGRYAGRINRGRFQLNGRAIHVASDPAIGGHCLHGGPNGLHARAWDVDPGADASSVTFRTRSEDGEEGFPGKLDVTVCYTLDDNTLTVEYRGVSDADTVLNLTNHAYFNLNGSGLVDGHEVTIHADAYAPVDGEGIPTGEILEVAGTEFDLRDGLRMQVSAARRHTVFDNTFVIHADGHRSLDVNGMTVPLAASATSTETGIALNVFTSQPSLQFYTGQFLDGEFTPFSGMCFEGQGFPDAPNQPAFPSTVLRAGDEYRHVIAYQFESVDGSV